jgi:ClpP class serine protease
MRFAHLLSRVTGTPWLITQDALENINTLLESRIAGITSEPVGAQAVDAPSKAPAGTAVIPIRGVIGKRLSSMEMMCGGADIEAIEAAFDAANADSNISRIVLAVDSPGGTVTGVPELAKKMYDRKRKPMIAVSDTVMGSAAYYLASAADEIIVTPTANVGSIGVVLQVRETLSTAAADGRTRLRVFRSGDDKMIGSDAPLTEAQAAMYQARTDKLGEMFRSDVTKARPNIADESMTGLTYFGEEAVTRGLADRVVRSLAEALANG